MSRAPLYLFDGTLLFFRALYGLPDVFQDARGRPVNGVRGFAQYLLYVLESRDVRQCAIAFDESLNTCWRNRVYSRYKANRPPADENILFQLNLCRQFCELVKLMVIADEEFEADDIIATLARRSAGEVVVISRDKDLQQLLRSGLTILNPADNKIMDAENFVEKRGFVPALFPDYQALTGDGIDNIPGVRGVGDKTATRLVATFGSLDQIYAAEDDWSDAGVKTHSKVAENMRAQKEEAFVFRSILRLKDDAELGVDLPDLRITRPAHKSVFQGVRDLEIGDGLGSALKRSLEAYCG